MAPRSPQRRHLPYLSSKLPQHDNVSVMSPAASSSNSSSDSTDSATPTHSSSFPSLGQSSTVDSPKISNTPAHLKTQVSIPHDFETPVLLSKLKLDPLPNQHSPKNQTTQKPIVTNKSQDFPPIIIPPDNAEVALINEEEKPSDYDQGGYHPVKIGERFNHDRYIIIQKLGWGHFSTVWLAHDQQLDRHVALKVVKAAKHYTETAEDEIKLLERVFASNPTHAGYGHVVSLLDHFRHTGPNGIHVCMVFEVLGENLLGLIKRYEYRGIPEPIVRKIARQILLGLDYLHRECGIIHTDLKPENVLISIEDVERVIRSELKNTIPENCEATPMGIASCQARLGSHDSRQVPGSPTTLISQPLYSPRGSSTALDKLALKISKMTSSQPSSSSGSPQILPETPDPSDEYDTIIVKIADLGNASWVTNHFTDDIQTRQYRSPEAIIGAPWGRRVDIWSAGCMFFELLTGDYLFNPDAVTKRYTKDDDHLAQIMELLGPFPLDFALSGKFSQALFNRRGELKRIPKLKYWNLESVMTKKYGVDKELVLKLVDCLTKMLQIDPAKRWKAWELLNDDGSWLASDI